MNPLDLLINLGISILSIVIALWYENLGTPRLKIMSDATTDDTKQDGRRTRFLHLKIINKPRRMLFVTRQTANSCHGDIIFFTADYKQIGNPMPIKWDGTPEPIKPEIYKNKIVWLLDPRLLRLTRFIDIPPDESESLAIAVKILGDNNAYGWTGESYLRGDWKHPNYTMKLGVYIARVKIYSGDSVFIQDFRFTNPKKFEKFDLLPDKPIRFRFFARNEKTLSKT